MHLGFQARVFTLSIINPTLPAAKSSKLPKPTTWNNGPTAKDWMLTPPNKSRHQLPATSRIFLFLQNIFVPPFVVVGLFDSSVMQESGDTYTWSLCIPRTVRQVTRINTIDDELNLSMWAVLLQRLNFPNICIHIHIGSV